VTRSTEYRCASNPDRLFLSGRAKAADPGHPRSSRPSGAQAHGRISDNPLFMSIPGFTCFPSLYGSSPSTGATCVTRVQHEFALLDHAYERTRQRNRGRRCITSAIEFRAPVQEKQQRQQGSTGQQDFKHEIRAPILPNSTQYPQTSYDYLHCGSCLP
jgi:hypothetical protein